MSLFAGFVHDGRFILLPQSVTDEYGTKLICEDEVFGTGFVGTSRRAAGLHATDSNRRGSFRPGAAHRYRSRRVG